MSNPYGVPSYLPRNVNRQKTEDYASESKAAPKYDKKEKSKKGCKNVHKDGMVCEVRHFHFFHFHM